jgi:hypothetical protein
MCNSMHIMSKRDWATGVGRQVTRSGTAGGIHPFQECDVLGMILVTVVTFPCSPLSLTIFSTKNY